MSKGPAPVVEEVTIEIDGRAITASYSVAEGMVTVHTHRGSKTTLLGNMPAHLVARIMLRELASEGKA